jgi:hypothetical protein
MGLRAPTLRDVAEQRDGWQTFGEKAVYDNRGYGWGLWMSGHRTGSGATTTWCQVVPLDDLAQVRAALDHEMTEQCGTLAITE